MKGRVIGAILAVVLIAAGGVYYFGFYSAGGTLNVRVSDPMPPGWSSVYVNISSVSIHNSTSGGHVFTKSFSTPIMVNLSSATSSSIFLTGLKLPAGHYQMISLVITGAYGTYDNAGKLQTYRFTLVNSTVKISGQFAISNGATTTETLDFNSAQAIHGTTTTGFTMTPVVSMIAS